MLVSGLPDKSKENSRDPKSLEAIQRWASEKKLDVVIWTDLESNFKEKGKFPKKSEDNGLFSVENALAHLQALDPEGKTKAAEYVRRAPEFVKTPLREALQSRLWFHENG